MSKFAEKEGVIESVYPRKNSLLRPKAANIDKLVILISEVPKPDFSLIDKMLVYAAMNDIKTYIAVNKADLYMDDLYKKAEEDYKNQVEDIILISTVTRLNIDKLLLAIENGLVCLVGQSAVGKSSLVNVISPEAKFETGTVSKINRGRNTTRHLEIVKINSNTFIIDTPGFSFLDLEIDPKDLQKYYFDFNRFSMDCKYTRCQHINEPDCAVKNALKNGEISQDRYERYKILREEIDEKWKSKYK